MSDLDDLIIGQLYEAAAGLLPWPTALASLTKAFNAMVVQYVSFDSRTDRMILCEQPQGIAVDAVLDYIREYNEIDPHARHMKALPLGTVWDTETEFPAQRMASHRFYREFWTPYGVRGLLGGKVDESEQHYSCIGIVRHKDSPGYDAADLALATRYVRHFATALKVARHFRALHMTSRVGVHLMTNAERPMILLDRHRRVLFANVEGRAFLDDGGTMVQRHGRLHGSTAASDRSLTATLERLTSATPIHGHDSECGRRAALRLEARSTPLILCTLWKLEAGPTSNAFGDDTTILLSIAHPIAGQPPDAHFVAAMLDLTPAEARLAAQLALGRELAEVVKVLGVSINTLKSQLRAIYAKTGTSRQAELVRLINHACLP